MDIEFLGRVLARMKPFVREGVIRRTRIERVLGTLQIPSDEVRSEVERLLRRAGIVIEEDMHSQEEVEPESTFGALSDDDDAETLDEDEEVGLQHDLPRVQADDALHAARRRLELDRHTRNHRKITLSAEEEVGLAMLLRGTSRAPLPQGAFSRLTGEALAAAECLFLHNQGLIHSVAQRLAPPGMTYEDVTQHGTFGLIRAVELFDPARGFKFSTYAMHWIRQAVSRGIANESRLIRLPVHMFERVRKVWAARRTLTVDGELPSVHQLALACGLTDGQIIECLVLGPEDILSLDAPTGADGETTLGDLLDLADPNLGPEQVVDRRLLRERIQDVLDTLSEREAGVISMRFGLVDDEERTLEEIGGVYGVTRERIRQVEGKALSHLRHPSRSQLLAAWMPGESSRARRGGEPHEEDHS